MKFASRQVKCGPTRSAVLGRLKMRARPSSASSRLRPSSRPARSIRTNAGLAPNLELYPQTPHIMPGRSANAVRGIEGRVRRCPPWRRITSAWGQRCERNRRHEAPPVAAREDFGLLLQLDDSRRGRPSESVRWTDTSSQPSFIRSASPPQSPPADRSLRREWSCGWLGRARERVEEMTFGFPLVGCRTRLLPLFWGCQPGRDGEDIRAGCTCVLGGHDLLDPSRSTAICRSATLRTFPLAVIGNSSIAAT